MNCPCCGQETDQPSLEALKWVTLTPGERVVLDTLIAAYPRRLTGEQIADNLYRGVGDGGPEYARRTVFVHLHHIRKKIAPTGWRAGGRGHGQGVGLELIHPANG